MAKKFRDELERRAFRAMLSHAFFRWESAFTIALTIILVFLFSKPFPWWQGWYWLILGGVAEALIIWTSLSDVETGQKVVAEMFRQKFDIRALRDKTLQERLEKALEYRHRIDTLVQHSEAGVLREHLRDTTAGVTDWIVNIFDIARRLDAYGGDKMIGQDLRSVPLAIKNFKERLDVEDDEAVKAQMRETIRSKEAQWQNLQRLQNTMEKAEFQLENTLAALGTLYTQLQLIGAKDVDSGRTQRLQEDISGQIASLQDIVGAMDEVYTSRGAGRG
jgi:hypothetical protein